MAASNSTGNASNRAHFWRENFALFRMRLDGLRGKEGELETLIESINTYAHDYEAVTGKSLRDARILEIGYGARPILLIAMISKGYDVVGIDLDRPTLHLTLAELIDIYRNNGVKRMLRTLGRSIFFDRSERSALTRVLAKQGAKLFINSSRFLVGDAATHKFKHGTLDFVFSENVFEHIPPDAIHAICKNLADALSDNGLAILTPDLYSGISGGHLTEWYPHTLPVPSRRQSEPWEHLRKRRIVADCYLNELRIRDYESIFTTYFDVVKVENLEFGLGSKFLDEAIRTELAAYSETELLSRRVGFWLRKKGVAVSANSEPLP